MQANRTKKQINDSRFLQLQNHWSVVEDAFRIEGRERQTDIFLLKEQLQERQCKQRMVDDRKGEILGHTLSKLNKSAQETKQNTDRLFEREAEFRINHLDKKNKFIQNYLNDGNTFNSILQQYVRDNVNDVDVKLQSTDAANIAKTNQVVKQIKEEVIADAQSCFSKEKDKYIQLFNKISSDSNNSMHKLKEKLKAKKKQREESVAKLRLKVNGLVEQLSKIYDKQYKQCEMKYDSLLKLLEQCCAKIQEAQLK